MRLSEKTAYNREFYLVDGTSIIQWHTQSDPAVLSRKFNRHTDGERRDEIEKLKQYHVSQKPDWFLRSERAARRFVRDMGITAAKGTAIYLLNPYTPEEYVDVFGSENYVACHTPGIGVLAPILTMELYYETGGTVGVASTLVHELMHSAEQDVQTVAHFYDHASRENLGLNSRQGLIQNLRGEHRGTFLQEGLANVMAGLYVRRTFDPSAELSSIEEMPSAERPSFYLEGLSSKSNGEEYGAGYDAHCLDMISWKAWKIGRMATKSAFLEVMLDTHSPDDAVRLQALRSMPQVMNAVDPFLYPMLRRVDYDVKQWREAMEVTYQSVMNQP